MTYEMQNASKLELSMIFPPAFMGSGSAQVSTGALLLPEGFIVHFSFDLISLAWSLIWQPSTQIIKQKKSECGEVMVAGVRSSF